MDIELADHVIVSDGEYISLAQSGLFRPAFNGNLE